jgi:hypothetical protein
MSCAYPTDLAQGAQVVVGLHQLLEPRFLIALN